MLPRSRSLSSLASIDSGEEEGEEEEEEAGMWRRRQECGGGGDMDGDGGEQEEAGIGMVGRRRRGNAVARRKRRRRGMAVASLPASSAPLSLCGGASAASALGRWEHGRAAALLLCSCFLSAAVLGKPACRAGESSGARPPPHPPPPMSLPSPPPVPSPAMAAQGEAPRRGASHGA